MIYIDINMSEDSKNLILDKECDDVVVKDKVVDLIEYSNSIFEINERSQILYFEVFEAYVRFEKILDIYIELRLKHSIYFNEHSAKPYNIYSDTHVSEFIFPNGILSREKRQKIIAITPQLEWLKVCLEGKEQLKESGFIRDYVAHLSPRSLKKLNDHIKKEIHSLDDLNSYLLGRDKRSQIRGRKILDEMQLVLLNIFKLE